MAKGGENAVIAEHLRYAAQLFGGEEVTPHTLMEWSQNDSTEELYARVDEVSKSLGQYLRMAENESNEQIIQRFEAAGFTHEQAKAVVVKVRHFGKSGFREGGWGGNRYFQDQWTRQDATGLENQSMDLVVALRDVAGLAWGGTEMSEGQNGDFMHFDLRNDPVGQHIVDFAVANNYDRNPKPTDPAKAKP